MVSLLVVQYVLGMAVNLYVHFPEGGSAAQNWEFMRGQWLIWAHLVVGTLLVLGTIALYVRAMQLKDKTWKIAGGIGAAANILAWISGEEIISRQQDIYSFAMSFFFIVAIVALGWGLYRTNPKAR